VATHYKLAEDGATPVPCSLDEWGSMVKDDRRRFVARDTFSRPRDISTDIIEVSTVFVGMDMSLGYNPAPVLWETMLFGDIDIGEGGNSWRHTSLQNALLVHAEIVGRVRGLLFDLADLEPQQPLQESVPAPVPDTLPCSGKRRINLDED